MGATARAVAAVTGRRRLPCCRQHSSGRDAARGSRSYPFVGLADPMSSSTRSAVRPDRRVPGNGRTSTQVSWPAASITVKVQMRKKRSRSYPPLRCGRCHGVAERLGMRCCALRTMLTTLIAGRQCGGPRVEKCRCGPSRSEDDDRSTTRHAGDCRRGRPRQNQGAGERDAGTNRAKLAPRAQVANRAEGVICRCRGRARTGRRSRLEARCVRHALEPKREAVSTVNVSQ
jgi:hypothetical protein